MKMKLNYNFLAAIIVVMCGVCFIAILHYTSFQRHHSHDWPHKHQNSGDVSPHNDNVSSGTSISKFNGIEKFGSAEPSKTKNAYTNGNSLQHYDHKSQVAMAFFTLLGLLVAIGGLILIWRTLVSTQKAAQAAADTLQVARRTMKSDRAWVYFHKFDTTHHRNFHFAAREGDPIEVFPQAVSVNTRMMNGGRTPAIIVKNFTHGWVGVGEPPEDFMTQEGNNANKFYIIGPSNQGGLSAVHIMGTDFDRWLARQVNWYIFGQTNYQTIYDEEVRGASILVRVVPLFNDPRRLWESQNTSVDYDIVWQKMIGEDLHQNE